MLYFDRIIASKGIDVKKKLIIVVLLMVLTKTEGDLSKLVGQYYIFFLYHI